MELYGSPVHLQEDNPLVHTFIACQSEVLGQPAEFVDSLGASDARYFAERGIPTIVEYPYGGNAHSDGEWLSRQSFFTFYDLITLYVERAARNASNTTKVNRLLAAPRRMVRSLLKR